MNVSLNEVEATAKKAARGAGHVWGIAEEAGKATRWLCAQGFDGCGVLARLLTRFDGGKAKDWMPQPGAQSWSALGGTLCPLLSGAALSDRADLLTQQPVVLEQVAEPLFLLSFAAMAARQTETTINVSWDGFDAATNGAELSFTGIPSPLAGRVRLQSGGALGEIVAVQDRADPDDATWVLLNGLAGRTYAPATEESRARGAGAGLTDND